eukprot:TRINITY_DN12704_c0_g1_i4.p1 TRINITY_DN12704_c0_g1~~TRINITY_DN12704_c0_g1_i4.p1  ORF type:complete len:280 (-),score=69.25 TRINITY_DN12704_c0_g1_i4:484-1323(-)
MPLPDPKASLDAAVDMWLKDAADDYLDECMPAGPIPDHVKKLFTVCRSRALQLEEVYPPSDDTFLMIERGEELLRCLLEAAAAHRDSMQEVNILEVGSGSGMISAALLQFALSRSSEVTCRLNFYTTDKNPLADMLKPSPCADKITCQSLQSNFADALTNKLDGKVDILVFNPPYVVTDDPEEMQGDGISISWAGGHLGREVIDAFLPTVPTLLRKAPGDARSGTPPACLLMCGIFENDPHNIIERAATYDLTGVLVDDRQRGDERLWAIRFQLLPAPT